MSRLYKNGKAERTDHRRANPNAGTRRDRIRDSKKFITVEREHDANRSFGSCLKVSYIDSNADGFLDKILPARRLVSIGDSKYSTAYPVSAPGVPTALTSKIAQFNIAPFETVEATLLATTPSDGTMIYSTDTEALYLYKTSATEWHHFKKS